MESQVHNAASESDDSAHEFVNLIRRAIRDSQCKEFVCTTCGGQGGGVRRALRAWRQADPIAMAEALARVDFSVLQQTSHGESCVLMALDELESLTPNASDHVLLTWLRRPQLPLRLLDYVLFYFVRRLPEEAAIRIAWIKRCEEVAVLTENESLVESVVWVYGSNIPKESSLFECASRLAVNSTLIRKAVTAATEGQAICE